MLDPELEYIHEEFHFGHVSPVQVDSLLAEGWRHFGTYFFRYNLTFYQDDIRRVIPLRIGLSNFSPSRSQRRILKKNLGLRTEIRPIKITDEIEQLFHRHKSRFDHAVPNTVYDFLSIEPASVPCKAKELAVYDSKHLIAISFFDVGERSISGIYGMFEPSESHRGLGIFTMLKEIEFAQEKQKEFYYQGYCYQGRSFYDYKKQFRGTEAFDWNGEWRRLEEL